MEICKGVRGAVYFLRSHGFVTTDSGDGSHFKAGMEGAMKEPMVALSVLPDDLLEEAKRLTSLLKAENIHLPVEATYYCEEDTGIILVYGKGLLNLGA